LGNNFWKRRFYVHERSFYKTQSHFGYATQRWFDKKHTKSIEYLIKKEANRFLFCYPILTEVIVNEPPTALSLKNEISSLPFCNPKV
jgi:hypothetical protein